MSDSPPSIVLLQRERYLSLIRGSIGANLFRHLDATVDGVHRDLAEDGRLSCALFVSSILTLVQRIDAPHATVSSTVRALERSGWVRLETNPAVGDVLVWEATSSDDGTLHSHIGFFIGDERAVSNSPHARTPIEHHWTFGVKGNQPIRRVEALYQHAALAPHAGEFTVRSA